MIIFTHRAIEKPAKHGESTFEAFNDQIARGYGLEFDPNFVKDGIIVWHDSTLKRLTGEDVPTAERTIKEFKHMRLGKDRLTTLDELFSLMAASKSMHALHLKGSNQTPERLARLCAVLDMHPQVVPKLLVFDIVPSVAQQLKKRYPTIHLAPSIAHEHDITRYNECVKGTLFPLSIAIKHRDVYDWVWLDEWDRVDKQGAKKFYTPEVFAECRKHNIKISLVTPELHATSPGLYGGEAHADAATEEKLFSRIKEIIALKPDAICTDYPEQCRKFASISASSISSVDASV